MASVKAKHYIKGMLWSSGANIVAMSASLATLMVAARILSKEDLGAYFLVMIIAQFAICFGDIGFKNAAVRFLSSAEGDDVNSISGYLLTINIIVSGIVCAILAMVLPELIKLWSSNVFEGIMWFSIPVVFLLNNFQLGLSVLAGHRLFRSMSIITVVIEILRMGASIGLLYFGYGVKGLLLSMLMSRAIGLGFVWYKLSSLRIKMVFRHMRATEIFKFGGWMYGNSLVSVMNVRLADAILTAYLGTEALAAYSTAKQIPSLLQKIFESVRPVVLGYISSLKLKSFESTIISVRLLSVFVALGATFLIAISQPLVIFIFSSKYEDSIPIMQLLTAWVSIGIVNYFLKITMTGMGYSQNVFLMAILQLIIMAGCTILLVPDYHEIGAAISLLITSVIGNVFGSWLVARKDFQVFYRLIFAFLRSSLPLIILAVFIVWESPKFIETAIFSFCTVLAFFLLRAITVSDIKLIINQVFYRG